MNFPYELFIGWRYTRAARRSAKNSFISFISLVSVAGIALGVAALIVVLSVMNGFQKEVRDRMLSVIAHAEVVGTNGELPNWQAVAEQVKLNPAVKASAPFVAAQALLTREDAVRGAGIRGVLPEQERWVSDIAGQIKAGNFADLKAGEFGMVIGAELARALNVRLGEKVALVAPQGQVTPAGMVPRIKQFTVVGIFEAGHFEYDSALAFIHLDDAEKMFKQTAPSGLRLKLSQIDQAPQIARELQQQLQQAPNQNFHDVWVRDWSRQNRNWFAAVQTEKRMMFIILTLIIAVAAFNLVSTLVMTVTEKQPDIAILRTLGATRASIMKIFMVQGVLTGIVGALSGVLLGVLLALNLETIVGTIERWFGIQFLPRDVYLISSLPSDLHRDDVLVIACVSLLLSLLATIYPSWRAAQVQPAEALRYE